MLTADLSPPLGRVRPRSTWQLRLLLVALLAVALVLALAPTVHSGLESGSTVRVTVAPGATVWSIASAHTGSGDIRAEVDAIIAANHLGDGTVVPGQELLVPEG